jgi:hypothetical protein
MCAGYHLRFECVEVVSSFRASGVTPQALTHKYITIDFRVV